MKNPFPFEASLFAGQYVAYSPMLKSIVANGPSPEACDEIVSVDLNSEPASTQIFYVPVPKIVQVFVKPAEGPLAGKEYLFKGEDAVAKANGILSQVSISASRAPAYDKVDVSLVEEYGDEYRLRFEVSRVGLVEEKDTDVESHLSRFKAYLNLNKVNLPALRKILPFTPMSSMVAAN